ncbi:MAG: alpha amylase C-terminal domain-containing protein [Pseudomonadota bacterium]
MRETPALYARDVEAEGFEWVDGGNSDASVLSWLRWGPDGTAPVLCIVNFTHHERQGWRFGVPLAGQWAEVLNTDAGLYGGSGRGTPGERLATAQPEHGKPFSIEVTLPPLSALFFQHQPE